MHQILEDHLSALTNFAGAKPQLTASIANTSVLYAAPADNSR